LKYNITENYLFKDTDEIFWCENLQFGSAMHTFMVIFFVLLLLNYVEM